MSWTVRGNPTPEELAVAVAVLSSRPAVTAAAEPEETSRWNDRAAMLRHPLPHGRGSWRATLR